MTGDTDTSPSRAYHYLMRCTCPHCGERVNYVKECKKPSPPWQDLPPLWDYCPECGEPTDKDDWDIVEKVELGSYPTRNE